MNLLQKLILFINLKRKNVRHAFCTAFCNNNRLTDGDYFFIIVVVCLLGIWAALELKEEIDTYTIKLSENNAKLSTLYARSEAKAHFNEKLVVSMLNGKIIVDGRLKSLCVYDAGGSCK